MLSELKPYISAIVFSPALLLLGIALGLWLLSKKPKLGKSVAIFSTALLWIISTPAFSVWLSHNLLTQYKPSTAQELKANGVQAIVVLGGGVETGQPDGIQQLKPTALDRLRHGIELSRQTGIPMLVTGGKGWGADADSENEAAVLKRVAREAFHYQIQWTESDSRDTRGNARNSKELLSNLGIQKIALVTHTWHMPRSMNAFEEVGFEVTSAPMGFIAKKDFELLSLLPNGNALNNTLTIVKELVGLLVQGQ
jgi:uncharacterized SAM-binding protein YcdF (DUF218 family)